MPKYILDPSGKIKNLENLSNDGIDDVAKVYAKRGGSTYSDGDATSFGRFADVDLPGAIKPFFGDKMGRHVITKVPKPQKENDSLFPKNDFESSHNSSFGADVGFSKYVNFNNYLTKGEIFATELEMAGTSIDLNSGGLRDITKLTLGFELIAEAVAYIAVIETTMQTQQALSSNYKINSSAIEKYFKDILKYPFDKGGSGAFGPIRRLTAFFLGLNHYVNADPLIDNLNNRLFGTVTSYDIDFREREFFLSVSEYVIDSVLSLSNIGSNRLLMLVRRFNQKSEWFSNKLYSAKDTNITKENAVEKFLAELNHYYVKFIIERMHVGFKTRDYYLRKRYKILNRSSRLKDSVPNNGLNKLSYDQKSKTLNVEPVSIENVSNKNKNRSSMSNALLPQAFIMPHSFIRSSIINNKDNLSLFNRGIVDEYISSYFLETEKHQERLSNDVVRKLEEYYEKEIMPFYFQDLRTNEIIGFHAFIDSITDNFNPNYVSTKGFGRIDDVKHYTDTTRNVNITFTLAAMSEKDHDLMWYQINKIVSMVYPQWSRGFKVDSKTDPDQGKSGKEYPFTQVPTASPLIRIRLGDVIKSNYTKHAIEKIHGSGNKEFNVPKKSTSRKFYTKDNKKYAIFKRDLKKPVGYIGDDKGENLSVDRVMSIIKKENYTYFLINNSEKVSLGKKEIDVEEIRPITINYQRSIPGYYDSYEVDLNKKIKGNDFSIEEDQYYAFFINKEMYITKGEDISIEYNTTEPDKFAKGYRKSFKAYTEAYTDQSDLKVLNNPITAAYESTFGKGLAGFITMLDVNYQDQLWEIERDGSKAPKLVKMTINFAPIHDIPPGLDADGAMRAPVYNAGRIVNKLYGNVYDN